MTENAMLDAQVLELDGRRGEIMLGKVHDFLGRFVAYPSTHAHVAHSLWIIHAHLMEKWDSTPRLAFLSPEPGSGKSRALEITELLVPRPVMAVNVSPAYLFRKVGSDEGRATILFDEIDTVFGPKAKDNEEIRGLLNAGHRRDAVTGRCVVVGKTVTTEEIPAYAPVALAGLGWLPETILNRSVIVRMRKRRHDEHVEQFRRRLHAPAGEALRHQVETWAASQTGPIEYGELPPEIQDRDADVWESLVAVADLVGGDWPERARNAAVTLVTAASDAEPSLGVKLLADIRAAFDGRASLWSGQLLVKLLDMEESPWTDIRGKPLDLRGLSRRLKEYGIATRPIRQGTEVKRGHHAEDFEDAWARYLPSPPAEHVTGVTALRPEPCNAVTDVTHFPEGRGW